jgi:hypothetical protein
MSCSTVGFLTLEGEVNGPYESGSEEDLIPQYGWPERTGYGSKNFIMDESSRGFTA